MKEAVNSIFWGFLLVFLRIDIGIDWLPDPLGYFLIASGCFKLKEQYPIAAQKAGYMATAMIFITVPTVFINVGEAALIGWKIYSVALLALKLIVVYFLFLLLEEINEDLQDHALMHRTKRVSRFYIAIYLTLFAYLSFEMNVAGSGWDTISIILTIGILIMDIVFLVLLRAIRRAEPV